MTTQSLNKFWAQFAKKNWEKKPLHCKKIQSSITAINEEQVFKMLVDYADHCRKDKSASGFKLFVQGEIQHEEDVLQILPVKKDKNLLGYHERMEKIFSDYCLVCDELLQVSQGQLENLKSFTNTLYSHVGFPFRFAEIGLYLGNYRTTPFGVHLDGCGVFSFPVVGKKKFRLWTPQFGKKHPELDRSHRYSKFIKDSKVMEAVPGDMTYWPSSAWHIAESDGTFNATWSLGVWVDRTFQENFEQALSPLLKKSLLELADKKTCTLDPIQLDGEVNQLPKDYQQAIVRVLKLSQEQLQDTMMIEWLKHASMHGLKSVPHARSQKKISRKSVLKMNSKETILWSRQKSQNKIVFAYHGVVIEASLSSDLLNLIQHLNRGQLCSVKDYLKSSMQKEDLRVIQDLSAAGPFTN